MVKNNSAASFHVRASFSTNLKFVDSMNFLSSLAFKNGCKPLQATSWKHLETEIYGFQRRRPWPAGIAPAKCYTATHAYSCKHMTHTRSQYDSICSKAVLFMTNLCLEVFGLHKWLHDRLDSLMPFLWPVTSLLQHVDLLWVPNHLGCWRQREAPGDVQIRVISLTRWNTCRLADANRVKILQASAELDKEVAVGLVVSSLSWLRHQSGTSAKCIFPSLHLTCLQPSVPRHHKLSKPLAASWATAKGSDPMHGFHHNCHICPSWRQYLPLRTFLPNWEMRTWTKTFSPSHGAHKSFCPMATPLSKTALFKKSKQLAMQKIQAERIRCTLGRLDIAYCDNSFHQTCHPSTCMIFVDQINSSITMYRYIYVYMRIYVKNLHSNVWYPAWMAWASSIFVRRVLSGQRTSCRAPSDGIQEMFNTCSSANLCHEYMIDPMFVKGFTGITTWRIKIQYGNMIFHHGYEFEFQEKQNDNILKLYGKDMIW